MKVKVVEKKPCFLGYEIHATEAEISPEYVKVLAQAAKEVNVEGFRKGNVPPEIVEKKYGSRLLEIVADNLYRNALKKLFEDDKSRPSIAEISQPEAVEQYTKRSMKIKFSIQTNPEIPTIKYEKIKLDLPKLKLSDNDKKEEMEKIAIRFGTLEPVPEGEILQNGQTATIDFVGRLKKQVVDSACGNDFNLEIGSKTFVPGFEEQLIGMKCGDSKTIVVKFPATYHAADFADQDVEFDVTLKAIQKKVPQTIDDEFAKRFGFTDASALESKIISDITDSHDVEVKRYAKAVVDNVLRDKYCDFPSPEVFLKPEVERIKQSLISQNSGKSDKAKLSEKEIQKQAEEKAGLNVCMSYIYRNIIVTEKIEPTDEEIRSMVAQDAMSRGRNITDALKELESSQEVKNYFRSVIQEEKAFEYILSKISVSYYDVPLSKFSEEIKKLYEKIKD